MATRGKRRLSWYVVWFTIFFFLLAAIFSIMITLPLWKVKNVSVQGTQMIAEEYVQKMAAYLIGENIFLADYSSLKERLGSVHQIKDYGVWRSLPQTVIIKVVERKPFCVVIVSKSSIVMDEEGFFLKVQGKGIGGDYSFVDIKDTSQLPVVRGIDTNKILSDRLDPLLSKTISVTINRLSKFFDPSKLQFELKKGEGLNLLVEDVLRVRFGEAEDISRKISVLEAILPAIEGKWGKVNYIDIRAADDPVIRYRSP